VSGASTPSITPTARVTAARTGTPPACAARARSADWPRRPRSGRSLVGADHVDPDPHASGAFEEERTKVGRRDRPAHRRDSLALQLRGHLLVAGRLERDVVDP